MEAQLRAFLADVDLPAAEIHEIDLEAQGLCEIGDGDLKFLAQFTNCVSVNLGENEVRKVSGPFPSLCKLAMLDFRENKLCSDILTCLTRLVNLEVLMLTHNSIKTIDKFAALKPLTKLHFLGLEGNPLTHTLPDYRDKIFAILPDLQVIDFVDRHGQVLSRPVASDDDQEHQSSSSASDLADFYNRDFSEEEQEQEPRVKKRRTSE